MSLTPARLRPTWPDEMAPRLLLDDSMVAHVYELVNRATSMRPLCSRLFLWVVSSLKLQLDDRPWGSACTRLQATPTSAPRPLGTLFLHRLPGLGTQPKSA